MLPILILFFLVLFVTPEMVPASTSCHRAMSAKSPNSSASKYLLRGRENSKSWLKWLRSGQNESSITSNDVHFLQTLKLDLILKVRNFKNPPLARVLRNLVMFKKKSPFMTNVENQNKVIVLAEELIEMIDNIKKQI